MVFHGSRLFYHGSRVVFHGSRSVFIVVHGSRSVSMIFMVLGGFSWFFWLQVYWFLVVGFSFFILKLCSGLTIRSRTCRP